MARTTIIGREARTAERRALAAVTLCALALGIVAVTAAPARAGLAPTASFNPTGGRNVAALEAGASVVAFSSQYSAAYAPTNMLNAVVDDFPWATGSGQLTNQYAKVQLAGGVSHTIDRVQIMPTSPYYCCATERVRDFAVDVSDTDSADASFATVLTATAANSTVLQEFAFPGGPVPAKFVRYRPINNRGSGCCISTGTLRVLTGAEVGRNVALLEAGAARVAVSSFVGGHEPERMMDYPTHPDDADGWYPWATSGVLNQFVKVQLAGTSGGPLLIDRVVIQPRSSCCPDQRVRDFGIDVSTTDSLDASFTTVLTGTAANNGSPQEFAISTPVLATYVRYRPLNNRGGCCNISTQRLKVFTGQQSATPTVTFTNLSTDPDNDIVSHLWDFGDGSATSTEQSPTHTFAAPGTYTVTLTVTDAESNTSTTSLTQKVLAPLVPGFTFAPAVPNEGQSVTFTDTSSSADTTVFRRTWSWGDGGVETVSTTTRVHAYGDNATYPVELTVVDSAERRARAQGSVTPLNVAPSVNVFGDRRWVSGERLVFGTTVTDPGFRDTLSCTWNHGDATTRNYCYNFDHTYTVPLGSAPQTFAATLTATDDDGGVGSDSLNTTVFPQMFDMLPTTSIPSLNGIDWSRLTNKLVVTRDGTCRNRLALVQLDGTINPAITPNIAKQCDQAKLAVSPGLGGFGLGDVFLPNGRAGEIARVRMNAAGLVTDIANPWVTITGLASSVRLRGIAFDDAGSFGNDLLVVWSDGRVHRVRSDGTFALVASFGKYLEGADVAAASGFGPASGCLLTTDVSTRNLLAACPDGTTRTVRNVAGASYELNSVTFVPAAGDLFVGDPDQGRVWRGDSRSFTSALANHTLVGTRYNGEVWEVWWDEASSSYQTRLFTLTMRRGQASLIHQEQLAFLPALASINARLLPASASALIGDQHTVTAVIRDSSGNPVAGLELTFTVTDGPHAGTGGTAVTDSSGLASFTYTGSAAGLDTIVASASSATTNAATVLWKLRGTTLDAEPAVARVSYPGGPAVFFPELVATLRDDATGTAVPGRTVSFYATDAVTGSPVLVCTATTDGGGVARCMDTTVYVPVALGRGYEARFAGDGTYSGDTDTAPLVRVTAEE